MSVKVDIVQELKEFLVIPPLRPTHSFIVVAKSQQEVYRYLSNPITGGPWNHDIIELSKLPRETI